MNTNLTKSNKNRLYFIVVLFVVFAGYILYNLYNIQILKSVEYQAKAIEQQTIDTVIKPKRGTIYDRNMEILAESAPVERIFIAPNEIETDELAVLIAKGLSEILDVDYDMVYEEAGKKQFKDRTIRRNVNKELANEVREFQKKLKDEYKEYKVIPIYFGQETKRVYYNGNLASHIIGFTGADGEGRLGIELQYDKELKGVEGRIITAKNAQNKPMALEYEDYEDAQNGSSIVLTIDRSIQYILENNLETALAESQAAERVTGIVMNVNNGEIYAMATKPDFDLNSPYELDSMSTNLLESMTFESEDDKNNARTNLLYTMWKNKAITEPYEPGSTFKVITAAMALEEDVVNMSDQFSCLGVHVVAGETIGCHLRTGHGTLTFAGGIQQSCNPVFMKAAEKLGTSKFLKYFDAFGYNEKTGVDLPGEASSITHSESVFRSVELAVSSFGQTFKVTPIQHITALAAVANGGKLVVPHVVKKIVDDNNNILKSVDTYVRRNVVSEEVCKEIAEAMAEGVKSGGSARNAFVKGYDIAAKTGTSQKRDANEDARIGSCIAFAPADNPEIIVMIIVDEPTVGSVFGGVIAAPYVSKVMSEVLPYLGFEPKYTEAEIEELAVPVMDYRGEEVNKAKKEIEATGLKVIIEGSGILVRDQVPKVGNTLPKGGSVILYTDVEENQNLITVPDVSNLTPQQANKKIIDAGLNIRISGAEDMQSAAVAVSQSPAAGEKVQLGTIVTVEFRHYENIH